MSATAVSKTQQQQQGGKNLNLLESHLLTINLPQDLNNEREVWLKKYDLKRNVFESRSNPVKRGAIEPQGGPQEKISRVDVPNVFGEIPKLGLEIPPVVGNQEGAVEGNENPQEQQNEIVPQLPVVDRPNEDEERSNQVQPSTSQQSEENQEIETLGPKETLNEVSAIPIKMQPVDILMSEARPVPYSYKEPQDICVDELTSFLNSTLLARENELTENYKNEFNMYTNEVEKLSNELSNIIPTNEDELIKNVLGIEDFDISNESELRHRLNKQNNELYKTYSSLQKKIIDMYGTNSTQAKQVLDVEKTFESELCQVYPNTIGIDGFSIGNYSDNQPLMRVIEDFVQYKNPTQETMERVEYYGFFRPTLSSTGSIQLYHDVFNAHDVEIELEKFKLNQGSPQNLSTPAKLIYCKAKLFHDVLVDYYSQKQEKKDQEKPQEKSVDAQQRDWFGYIKNLQNSGVNIQTKMFDSNGIQKFEKAEIKEPVNTDVPVTLGQNNLMDNDKTQLLTTPGSVLMNPFQKAQGELDKIVNLVSITSSATIWALKKLYQVSSIMLPFLPGASELILSSMYYTYILIEKAIRALVKILPPLTLKDLSLDPLQLQQEYIATDPMEKKPLLNYCSIYTRKYRFLAVKDSEKNRYIVYNHNFDNARDLYQHFEQAQKINQAMNGYRNFVKDYEDYLDRLNRMQIQSNSIEDRKLREDLFNSATDLLCKMGHDSAELSTYPYDLYLMIKDTYSSAIKMFKMIFEQSVDEAWLKKNYEWDKLYGMEREFVEKSPLQVDYSPALVTRFNALQQSLKRNLIMNKCPYFIELFTHNSELVNDGEQDTRIEKYKFINEQGLDLMNSMYMISSGVYQKKFGNDTGFNKLLWTQNCLKSTLGLDTYNEDAYDPWIQEAVKNEQFLTTDMKQSFDFSSINQNDDDKNTPIQGDFLLQPNLFTPIEKAEFQIQANEKDPVERYKNLFHFMRVRVGMPQNNFNTYLPFYNDLEFQHQQTFQQELRDLIGKIPYHTINYGLEDTEYSLADLSPILDFVNSKMTLTKEQVTALKEESTLEFWEELERSPQYKDLPSTFTIQDCPLPLVQRINRMVSKIKREMEINKELAKIKREALIKDREKQVDEKVQRYDLELYKSFSERIYNWVYNYLTSSVLGYMTEKFKNWIISSHRGQAPVHYYARGYGRIHKLRGLIALLGHKKSKKPNDIQCGNCGKNENLNKIKDDIMCDECIKGGELSKSGYNPLFENGIKIGKGEEQEEEEESQEESYKENKDLVAHYSKQIYLLHHELSEKQYEDMIEMLLYYHNTENEVNNNFKINMAKMILMYVESKLENNTKIIRPSNSWFKSKFTLQAAIERNPSFLLNIWL